MILSAEWDIWHSSKINLMCALKIGKRLETGIADETSVVTMDW